MKRPLVILLLKYSLGVGVLAWLIWSHWHIEHDGKEEGLAAVFERPFHTEFFLLATALCLGSLLLTILRWYFLVRAQELPFTVASAMRLGLVGYFMSTFMPGSVGGDIVKAAFLAREQSRRTVAVATVLVDRLVGLMGLVWLTALLGSVFWASGAIERIAQTPRALAFLETIVWSTGAVTLASVVTWVLMGVLPFRWVAGIGAWLGRWPKVGGSLRELWGAVWLYRRKTGHVALALGLSLISHAGFFLTFYCAARSVSPAQEIPSLEAHFLIVPVGTVIQGGFPAPGGMGGAEFGFGLLYEEIGYSRVAGVWGSLIQRSITWILGFLGYLVYLRMRGALPQRVEPTEEHPPSGGEPKAGPILSERTTPSAIKATECP